MGTEKAVGGAAQERLLRALAEQLKNPFLQIARRAELSRSNQSPQSELPQIEDTAQLAVRLIDNYLLASESQQTFLPLETVSISAILHEAAEQLMPVARQYNCELELSLSGRYEPVMANANGLRAALVSLGHAFVEAGQSRPRQKHIVQLAAHRGRRGIVAGVFVEGEGLSGSVFNRAKALHGRARQPLISFSASSAAGIFVADSLLTAMNTQLRIASHHRVSGLAATFVPSHQLSLV